MEATSRAVSIPVPEPDSLTQVLQLGAQRVLAQAIEGEVAECLIAASLGRSPGTISRKLARNRVGGEYFAA